MIVRIILWAVCPDYGHTNSKSCTQIIPEIQNTSWSREISFPRNCVYPFLWMTMLSPLPLIFIFIYIYIKLISTHKSTDNIKLNVDIWSNPTKIRGKKRLPTLSISIQHSTWSSSWSNKTTKSASRDTHWKRRSQTITICPWYNSIHKWFLNFTIELLQLINNFSKVAKIKLTQR